MSENKNCKAYLGAHTRIENKKSRLEKRLANLEKCRSLGERINPNTNKPAIVRPLENIVRDCRIGRKKENYTMEDFKKRPRKRPDPILEAKKAAEEK